MEDNILDQPASPEGHYNFDEKVQQLLSNGYSFHLSDYISAGHKILMKNLGGYIGYLLIFVLISIVIGIIPIVGSIANFVIGYSLIMGFAIVARKIYYNRPYQFGNFFDGFKLLGPLVLLRLLQTLAVLVIAVPYVLIAAGPLFAEFFRTIISGDMPGIDPQQVLRSMLALIPLFFILLIMYALFALSPYIATFGRKGAWDSLVISIKIVGKQLLNFILFFIVIFLINIGGALLLLIGLLYTVPLTLCSMYAAYEMIIGTNPNDPLLDPGQV